MPSGLKHHIFHVYHLTHFELSQVNNNATAYLNQKDDWSIIINHSTGDVICLIRCVLWDYSYRSTTCWISERHRLGRKLCINFCSAEIDCKRQNLTFKVDLRTEWLKYL